jgi:antitoxin component of RelBE/YafQ-DinJ toxin-antitoxin module
MTARVMVSVPDDVMQRASQDAASMGLPIATILRSYLSRFAQQLPTEKTAKPSKPTTVVKNNHLPVDTEITHAERLQRFWDNRNEETKAALRRGWPIPIYDDNPRVWVQTGEYEGEWVEQPGAPSVDEEFEAEQYEEYQRQQKETA